VLEALPQRIGRALLDTLDPQRRALAWKAPNDLVAAASGAKVCGILVDARTTGSCVEQVIVGIGCNLDTAAFTTVDGRAATSLTALAVAVPDVTQVARVVADQLRVTVSS
jgi:biotin-(acetyl-CoA carboxylase) ligase